MIQISAGPKGAGNVATQGFYCGCKGDKVIGCGVPGLTSSNKSVRGDGIIQMKSNSVIWSRIRRTERSRIEKESGLASAAVLYGRVRTTLAHSDKKSKEKHHGYSDSVAYVSRNFSTSLFRVERNIWNYRVLVMYHGYFSRIRVFYIT